MKKDVILVSSVIVAVLIIVLSSVVIFNNSKLETKALEVIDAHIKEINSFVNKYEVMNSGIVEVSANYKGAHGESYPAEFVYNYELTDKLYFENEVYSYLDINNDALNVIRSIKKIGKFDVNNYKNKNVSSKVITYSYDVEDINSIFNTSFKKAEIKVFTKGIYKTVDYIEVDLDECKITINKKDISIVYGKNDIDLVKNDAGYYLSINGKLKCNIFVNDDNYSFSIVLNNTVYYLELRDDGLVIKFTSSAAIYNNIDIKVTYGEDAVTKGMLSENFDDNPIIRYLSKSDLSLWR